MTHNVPQLLYSVVNLHMVEAIRRIDDTIQETEMSLARVSDGVTSLKIEITVTTVVSVIAVSTVVIVMRLNNCVASATKLTSGVASTPLGKGQTCRKVIIQPMYIGPSIFAVRNNLLPVNAYNLVARKNQRRAPIECATIRSCCEDISSHPDESIQTAAAFICSMLSRAPNLLVSCVEVMATLAHVQDMMDAVRYGRMAGEVCRCWPYRSAAIVLAFRRKQANMTLPVQEHSTCASGSQNMRG